MSFLSFYDSLQSHKILVLLYAFSEFEFFACNNNYFNIFVFLLIEVADGSLSLIFFVDIEILYRFVYYASVVFCYIADSIVLISLLSW